MDEEDYRRQQDEDNHLASIIEQAEEQWEAEQVETGNAIQNTVRAAAAQGMNIRLWKDGRDMLLSMIDATENGDAIREDFESDPVAQNILLEAYASVRLAFSKIDGALKEVGVNGD